MRFIKALCLFLWAAEPANAFTSTVSRRCCGAAFSATPKQQKKAPFALHGLLDDFESSQGESSDSAVEKASDDDAYERLFDFLVFSANAPRMGIEDRWDQGCGDPEFAEFLASKMASADDEEERQAYEGLINIIGEVRKVEEEAEAKVQAEEVAREESRRQREEEIANSVQEKETVSKSMTTAEVLKAAGKIGEGNMSASKEALEGEGSDFIRDAKATVGLGGFNNKGQMSVGGD